MSSNETDQSVSTRAAYYRTFYQTDLTAEDQKKIIDQIDFVYGFDIPALIITFLNTQLDGYLKFTDQNNNASGISFFEGQIQNIDVSDAETKIGNLLINNRIISKEILEKALQEKGDLPVGVYLLQKNWVKAEQIGEIILTQSRMRLSKLINDNKYRLSFEDNKMKFKTSEMNLDKFNVLLHDWVASKFSESWLVSHYLEYYGCSIKVNWENIKFYEGQNYPLLSALGVDFFEKIENGLLSDLANAFEKNKNFFKAIHFLTLLNWIELVPSAETDNNYEIRLKHIYKLVNNKSDIDLLNELSLITKQDPHNIENIFEMIKSEYIEKVEGFADLKLEIVKKLMNLLLNHKNLISKINNQSSSGSQQQIDLNPIHKMLVSEEYIQALTHAKKFKNLISSVPKLQIYIVWAQAALAYFKGTAFSVSQLENEFMLVLPEDINSADYYYVQALIYKAKRQDSFADKSFKTAVSLNAAIKNYPFQKSLFGWFKF